MPLNPLNQRPSTAEYPPGTMKIEKIWLYVCRDENGDEGVCAATMPGGIFLPLIAADLRNIKGRAS